MTVPSEFALLHNGKRIVILANCILRLITNLLISYIVFANDFQKPSKALHLKGLDSSFQFCCQAQVFLLPFDCLLIAPVPVHCFSITFTCI